MSTDQSVVVGGGCGGTAAGTPGPSLGAGHRYDAGIIVESWRLWESMCDQLPGLERISCWSLDADYFRLSRPGCSIAVLIAQGASIVADAAERLNGAGATVVVRIGTAGGLQQGQRVGEAVIVEAAVRGEGTSGHYLPAQMPALADWILCEQLRARLEEVGVSASRGLSWTTDGRWTESDEEIRLYSALGVLSVDMESAALLACGWKRRLRCASVSLLADLPIDHLGHKFKGIANHESEWNLVLESFHRTFLAVIAAIDDLRQRC